MYSRNDQHFDVNFQLAFPNILSAKNRNLSLQLTERKRLIDFAHLITKLLKPIERLPFFDNYINK